MTAPRLGLFFFAVLTAFSTFILICSGGLVTSHGVGMAVPDWPTTYGYNMFLFPVSQWVGGVFYEHTHRLIASGIGLLTVILAIGLLIFEPRRWVKNLGLVAVVAVIVQGVLGGLRVTLIKNEIGIFHALLAQSFFVLLGVMTVALSPWFIQRRWSADQFASNFRWVALAAVGLIFFQLFSAAAMRHSHSQLSIPDFPLAYGKWWPPMDAASVAKINEQRLAATKPPTTAFLIGLQMVHRLGALATAALIFAFTWKLVGSAGTPRGLRVWSMLWSVIVVCQILLGAWTIWSDKAADVATAHVALGAVLLLLGGLITFRLFYAHGACRRELLARGEPDLVEVHA